MDNLFYLLFLIFPLMDNIHLCALSLMNKNIMINQSSIFWKLSAYVSIALYTEQHNISGVLVMQFNNSPVSYQSFSLRFFRSMPPWFLRGEHIWQKLKSISKEKRTPRCCGKRKRSMERKKKSNGRRKDVQEEDPRKRDVSQGQHKYSLQLLLLWLKNSTITQEVS